MTYWRDCVKMGITPYNHLTDFNWDMLEGDIWPNGKTFCWYAQIATKSDCTNTGLTREEFDKNFFSIPNPVTQLGDKPYAGCSPYMFALTTASQADEKTAEYVRRILDIVLDADIQLTISLDHSHIAITDECVATPEYSSDVWMQDQAYITPYMGRYSPSSRKADLQDMLALDSITIFYNGLILQILSSESELMQDIRPFADCFRLFGVLRNAEMLKSSLTAMIDNLMPAETDSQESTADTIKRIVRFVDENYHQDITLEQLAQKHYISVSYLSRKFKETMDVNFSDYLSRKRIEKASRLLESTDLSVSEIGAACGYPNCFYFSRTFKKITGVSPSAYRDKEDTDEE